MNEAQAYDLYEQAKNKLRDAISDMKKCQEPLNFSDDDIVNDIRDKCKEEGVEL